LRTCDQESIRKRRGPWLGWCAQLRAGASI